MDRLIATSATTFVDIFDVLARDFARSALGKLAGGVGLVDVWVIWRRHHRSGIDLTGIREGNVGKALCWGFCGAILPAIAKDNVRLAVDHFDALNDHGVIAVVAADVDLGRRHRQC